MTSRRKVALVTGASRSAGIGAAVARELAAFGMDLFLTGWPAYDEVQPWGADAEGLEALVAELRAAGAEAESWPCDLARPEAAAELFERAMARFGRVDVLVNNAAHSEAGDLERLDADQLDRHYALNLRAPALLCREFVRRLADRRAGRIVNITSGQGTAPMPDELAYAATKGGLDALTVSLAAEVADRRITVNAIDPGPTDTGWMSDELRAELAAASPSGRIGRPADVARLVRFLVSDAGAGTTGRILRAGESSAT